MYPLFSSTARRCFFILAVSCFFVLRLSAQKPAVYMASPDSGYSGTGIMIYGINFTGATAVSFENIPAASFTVLNDTSIYAVVGNGATGTIAVSVGDSTGAGTYFKYLGPNVSFFNPQSGGQGTTVSITGTNFTGVTAVHFGGIPAASFTVNSPTSITAVTGVGATGSVTVTGASGTGTRNGFTAPPRITSFSPLSGPVGSTVTITGNSFSAVPGGNIVYIGGVRATVTAATTTALSATVPAGAAYLPITVRANGYTGYAARPFTVTFAGGPLIPAFFAQWQPLATGVPVHLRSVSGDLNNDGKPELACALLDGSLRVYKNTSTPGDISYAEPLSYTTDGGPNNGGAGLVIADFSGDGEPDIAIINNSSGYVSVFRNTSRGDTLAFASRVIFYAGNGPSAIAAGDVDGDGRPDMVVTNVYGNTIAVFRNTSVFGAVSFAAKIDYATGTNPNAVVLTDIDGDGKSDIAAVNEGASSFSVFRNTGSSAAPAFAPRVDVATLSFSRSIAAADFDGDGDMDLVLSNGSTAVVSVFSNTSSTGSISFAPRTDLATVSGSNSVAVSDADGDGKPDITATNFGTGSFSVLKNTGSAGSIAFAAKVDYALGTNPGHHILGDADGDGKPDMAAADIGILLVRNKVNDAPVISSFSPAAAYPGDTVVISGRNFTGAAAATYGGTAFNSFTVLSDKVIRAIPGTGGSGAIAVTTPYGTATRSGFSCTLPPAITGIAPVSGPVGSTVTISGSNFSPVAANNTVSFGTARAVVTAATANSITVQVPAGASQQRVAVLANGRTAYAAQLFTVTFPGAGPAFTASDFDTSIQVILPSADGIWGINTGDADGDGKPDLAVSCTSGSTRYFSTLRNITGSNTIAFAPRTNHLTNEGGSGAHPFIDIDQDGKPEILFNRGQDAYPVTIFKNSSSTGVINLERDITLYYAKTGGFKLVVADVDADGRTDIIIKSDYSYDIVVCRNTSNGSTISFAAPLVVGGAGLGFDSGGQLIAEDFSGDGRPDIAVVTDNVLTVLRNTGAAGSIAFASGVSFSSGGSARVGCAADFDGDGRIDIAKSSTSLNAVAVLRNNSSGGTISFETAVNLAAGFTPAAIAAADMDGDGKPDICVNRAGSKILAVFKNNSSTGALAFAAKTEYTGNGPGYIHLSDIDSDGRPDILTAATNSGTISVLRNNIGGPLNTTLCPPAGNGTITSNISGATYQWQVNSGSGFANISDGPNYSNTNTAALQLTAIPSSWYGYQYRCMAGGSSSNVFILRFSNRWTGAVSTDWSNPANWSCGTVPDVNTDVIINSGTVVINASVTIRSLKINPGASLTVGAGFVLTVLY